MCIGLITIGVVLLGKAAVTTVAAMWSKQRLTATHCFSLPVGDPTGGSVEVVGAGPGVVRPIVAPVRITRVAGRVNVIADLQPDQVLQMCRLTGDRTGTVTESYITTTPAGDTIDGTVVDAPVTRRLPIAQVLPILLVGVLAMLVGLAGLYPQRLRLDAEPSNAGRGQASRR
jgi:hypothetical protein